jgi:predicted nucleotidyltransferase
MDAMNDTLFLEPIRRQLPALGEEHQAELARIIASLVAALEPDKIYVFGSQARGDTTPDSDVDLLVLVPTADRPAHQLAQAAHRAIGWHSLALDILVMWKEEFAWRSRALASLPATVLREGRTLYAA